MEHTPGPWQVYHPYDGGTWVVTHLLDGTRVMIVPRVFSGTTGSKEMQQANAQLIAASPALKEACELGLAVLNGKPPRQITTLGEDDHDGGCPLNGPEDCLYCIFQRALALTQVEEAK